MKKGSGTRSGLLWEVERLLNETKKLPQVLLMENVPQVHSEVNKADFDSWIDFLRGKGYFNFYKDLNAKDYGVAQSRDRCFMVSFLSEDFQDYNFPEEKKLDKTVIDYLEDEVDEKYYINSEKAKELILELKKKILMDEDKKIVDLCYTGSRELKISPAICARYDCGIIRHKCEHRGVLEWKK